MTSASSGTAGTAAPTNRQRRRAGRLAAVLLALPIGVVGMAQTDRGGEAAAPVAGQPPDASRTAASAYEGRVAAYLLSPDAGVDGLLFDDGRQLRVPPHLGPQLAKLARPGDRVRVAARDGDAAGPGRMPAITAVATGKTLSDARPATDVAPPRPPLADGPRATLARLKLSGTIRQLLTGQRGEVNGLVLDNRAQVSFPPQVAAEAGTWLVPGAAIEVDGYGRSSAFGTVVQATVIGREGGPTLDIYRPTRRLP